MKVEYTHDTEVHNSKDAEILFPKLIAKYNVSSLVDVGCGIGTWLSVFPNMN